MKQSNDRATISYILQDFMPVNISNGLPVYKRDGKECLDLTGRYPTDEYFLRTTDADFFDAKLFNEIKNGLQILRDEYPAENDLLRREMKGEKLAPEQAEALALVTDDIGLTPAVPRRPLFAVAKWMDAHGNNNPELLLTRRNGRPIRQEDLRQAETTLREYCALNPASVPQITAFLRLAFLDHTAKSARDSYSLVAAGIISGREDPVTGMIDALIHHKPGLMDQLEGKPGISRPTERAGMTRLGVSAWA